MLSVTYSDTSAAASPELFRAAIDLDPFSDFLLLANTVTTVTAPAGSGDSGCYTVYDDDSSKIRRMMVIVVVVVL